MLEQVIPVGSVGYIDPLSRKFIILFNAIDPASSTEPRIHGVASVLEGETTRLIMDPKLFSCPGVGMQAYTSQYRCSWSFDRSEIVRVPLSSNHSFS